MPWKINSLQEQRWTLVRSIKAARLSVCEICRRMRVSRKTAYKWLERYRLKGMVGLANRPSIARQIPHRTTPKWLERIRTLRSVRPYWGSKKLRRYLLNQYPDQPIPSSSTMARWLRKWGLTKKRPRRVLRGPTVLIPELRKAHQPNEVWTVDFKGWFRTGDGTRIEGLTVKDLATRYGLAIRLLRSQNVLSTRVEFQKLFQKYGLPNCIRSDNGCPFGSTGPAGLTRLSAWWVKLGIEVEFITPGHPEQNGAHEQFHRVLKAETAQKPASTLKAQQRRSNEWLWEFNHERPHEALSLEVPAKRYRRSQRKLPRRTPQWRYPSGWESRWVKGNGEISRKGRRRFIGEAFVNDQVGLKALRPGVQQVYFGPIIVGQLHDTDGTGLRPAHYRRELKTK